MIEQLALDYINSIPKLRERLDRISCDREDVLERIEIRDDINLALYTAEAIMASQSAPTPTKDKQKLLWLELQKLLKDYF